MQIQKKVKNILDRCLYNTKKTPGFLTNLRVPFENNQAEKDIIMTKLQHKYKGLSETLQIRQLSAELKLPFLQSHFPQKYTKMPFIFSIGH